MKIEDISANQGSISVEGKIIEIGQVRQYEKYGRTLRVADAILQDETGTIKLSLWNEEIERVHNGDKIRIINGYSRAFKDELQLSAGKYGKIEVTHEAGPLEKAEETEGKKDHQDNPLFEEDSDW